MSEGPEGLHGTKLLDLLGLTKTNEAKRKKGTGQDMPQDIEARLLSNVTGRPTDPAGLQKEGGQKEAESRGDLFGAHRLRLAKCL